MTQNKTTLSALVIEDVEDDVLLLQNELKRSGYQALCTRVDTPQALREAINENGWDIIFCDYSMPKMNGRQALSIVREIDQDIPFIFVSGSIGEDIAVEAMRTGAQDYIMKDSLKRLAPAVRRELKDAKERQEKRKIEERLSFLTNYDHLTHLPNRILFRKTLEEQLEKAQARGEQLAVICVDLDRFTNVNDSLGYDAGDILLKEMALRLKSCLSPDEILARFTADEFFILIPQLNSKGEATELMDKILQVLDEPYNVLGCKLYLNASIGMTLFPEDAESAETMLRNADIATSRAKSKGGKGYCLYTADMTVKLEELMVLEQAMRQALTNDEFVLHFQPQIELNSGRLIGVEALVRWQRPGFGMVPPDQFIPLAEETGLIIALGEWVLRAACRQACHWRDANLPQVRVAVNVSPIQFHQKDLVEQVTGILEELRLDPGWLEIEVTEGVIMHDTESALKALKRLQRAGISLSLDDFGTGYSSLSYLKHFKVDNLKIDRSFIKDIPQDKDDAAITSAIIAMANKLGIKVIAEGVETQQQCTFLSAEGCDSVQGYYLGRPMDPERFAHWLSEDYQPG